MACRTTSDVGRVIGTRVAASCHSNRRCVGVWRAGLVIAVAFVLDGCYPALKVIRPRVDLTVRDAAGAPVENASVTLATFHYPFPSPRSTMLARYETDGAGALSLRKRRKWLWQILLPDGVRWYGWAYCVEKPGYRAVAAVEPDFKGPMTVVLEPSTKTSACKWPVSGDESYYAVEVVER